MLEKDEQWEERLAADIQDRFAKAWDRGYAQGVLDAESGERLAENPYRPRFPEQRESS